MIMVPLTIRDKPLRIWRVLVIGLVSSPQSLLFTCTSVSLAVKHYTLGLYLPFLCGFSPTPNLITSAFDTFNRLGQQQLCTM